MCPTIFNRHHIIIIHRRRRRSCKLCTAARVQKLSEQLKQLNRILIAF